ncbi:MAG: hypothetical protein AVDCRST_MAG22-77 [uncultured Rubrobacteraceae bacterium]|uniref:Peptidase MA-like domain-containing protein n=1 Tax=uncultured Rubrobacteraceae bacterium TaxID=349277 RepID=A0A6J4NAD0_9ACTN|nr:MAG: hypothetical protein AVDCRST_MAG22-77 [uncultured Rubrobacteraceae bacterium]
MGSPGSAVANAAREVSGPFPGYRRLEGPVPLFYAPRLAKGAREVRGHLARGSDSLAAILGTERPELSAFLVADEDWDGAPRENEHPYPPGLPYFTRSVEPPALVLPERLSPVFRPRTGSLLPLAVWHELAHAFLLGRPVVRTPVWLGELVPQAASAAVARRAELPLEEHLGLVDRNPGSTVRGFAVPAGVEEQMRFQNLLLLFGAAALREFGEGFLAGIFRALWDEKDVVGEARAEELLAGALGPGGQEWLRSRPEF